MPWQAMQVDSYTFLPSATAGTDLLPGALAAATVGAVAGAAGSLNFAPPAFAMYTTARSTSRSLRSDAPPRGGIAPSPFNATCTSAFWPARMRGPQSRLSPNFGALAIPVEWQAVHTVW